MCFPAHRFKRCDAEFRHDGTIPCLQALVAFWLGIARGTEMRERTFYLAGVPIAVVMSAAIAYGIVFVLPKMTGYDYISTYTPHGSDVVGGYYDTSYPIPNIEDLTKLQPEEFQGLIQDIFDSLVKLPDAQLYMLNAVDDVCRSTIISCQGVPSKIVKPFIERALAYKQASETNSIAAGGLALAADGLTTARWSLAIAIAALLLSLVGPLLKVIRLVLPKDRVS